MNNEALRLAEMFDSLKLTVIGAQNALLMENAAAELRRLHEELEAEKKRSEDLLNRLFRLDLLNDNLIEALISFTKSDFIKKQHPIRYANAKAALSKATGESNA